MFSTKNISFLLLLGVFTIQAHAGEVSASQIGNQTAQLQGIVDKQRKDLEKNLADKEIFRTIDEFKNSTKFKNATSIDEKMRLLQNEYLWQVSLTNKSHTFKSMLLYALPTAAILGGTYLAYTNKALDSAMDYLNIEKAPAAGATPAGAEKQVIRSIANLTVYGGLTSLALIPGVQALINLFFLFPMTEPEFPTLPLQLSYVRKKPFLTEDTQEFIEGLFYQYWRNPRDESQDRLKRVLDVALRMPIARKVIELDTQKVKEHFKNFDSDLQETLTNYVFSQVLNQQILISGTENPTRFPTYFVGKPGTGKSYGAAQIAKAVGLPLAKVNLDGATIDDMVGTSYDSFNASPGRIVEALIANARSRDDINFTSQVLFIDEFDRLLEATDKKSREALAFMLKVLDPDQREFYCPFLRTKVKLPDIIILAGNSEIKSDALESRLEMIVFKGFTKEAKKNLAIEYIIPNLAKKFSSIKSKNFVFGGVTDKMKDEILSAVSKDSDPGLRSLTKTINTIMERSIRNQYHENLSKK